MKLQKFRSSNLLLSVLVSVLVMVSCNPSPEESDTAGALGVGLAARTSPTPIKPRSVEVVATFRNELTKTMGVRGARSNRTESPRVSLRRSLFSALGHVGGMPRSQLRPVMGALVAPSNNSCGGASCSRIFGLKSDQVDGFLDESRETVETKWAPKSPDEQNLKNIVLASLTPEEALKPKLTLEERLATLKEKGMPPSAKPSRINAEGPAFAALSKAELSAIRNFTFQSYQGLRLVQTRTTDELLKLGVPMETIAIVRQMADTLEKTLTKLPKTPGLVFRGISGLKKKDWEDLFVYKEKRSFVTLGQNNMPATTSASWSPIIATNYLYQNTDGLKVVFGIKQRRGVAIENISVYPYEQEVMLPASSLYQITDISYFERRSDVLYVEMVEVLRL